MFSQNKPPKYFYHTQPQNRKKTLVRFCENEKETNFGWEYEEHSVEVETKPNMDEYIQNHWNELRQEAIGGMSLLEQLCATVDYLSMMSGISIPTEEGAARE